MTTPWVAGKRYAVTCVALDAKPAAEITFYKGKLRFWQIHLRTFRHGHPERSKPKPQSYFKFCDLHRSQPEYQNIKQSRGRRSNVKKNSVKTAYLTPNPGKKKHILWEELARAFKFPNLKWVYHTLPVVYRGSHHFLIPPLDFRRPCSNYHGVLQKQRGREVLWCSPDVSLSTGVCWRSLINAFYLSLWSACFSKYSFVWEIFSYQRWL